MVYLHTVGRVLDSGGSLGWSSDDVPELDSQELGHLLAVLLAGSFISMVHHSDPFAAT